MISVRDAAGPVLRSLVGGTEVEVRSVGVASNLGKPEQEPYENGETGQSKSLNVFSSLKRLPKAAVMPPFNFVLFDVGTLE